MILVIRFGRMFVLMLVILGEFGVCKGFGDKSERIM